MKPKKLNKKLNLNKTTISNLSTGEQGKIRGGYVATNCAATCFTWCARCVTQYPQICGITPNYTNVEGCTSGITI